MALRSIVRNRARSAAVVMALAAINGGAIAMGTAFASRTERGGIDARLMPDNALVLIRHTTRSEIDEAPTFVPIDPSVERMLRTVLPNASWSERRAVVGTVNEADATRGGPPAVAGKLGFAVRIPDAIVVADPPVLALVGLSPSDAATLQRVGAMVLPEPGSNSTPPVTVMVGTGASARAINAARPAQHIRATAGVQVLITAAEAQRSHAPIVSAGAIVTNRTPFNETQRASIDALAGSIMFGPSGAPVSVPRVGSVPGVVDDITDLLWAGPRASGISPETVRQIILAIVVVIALIVLGMSLALSAAETRDERDVLVSLGATPRTTREVAAWKAATLSFTGAALAIPTGFIPVAVAYHAAIHPGDTARLAFPLSTALELLVVAPFIAAVVAGMGSAIAQRVRPTRMSTFAMD